jgi:hypothetical protein
VTCSCALWAERTRPVAFHEAEPMMVEGMAG